MWQIFSLARRIEYFMTKLRENEREELRVCDGLVCSSSGTFLTRYVIPSASFVGYPTRAGLTRLKLHGGAGNVIYVDAVATAHAPYRSVSFFPVVLYRRGFLGPKVHISLRRINIKQRLLGNTRNASKEEEEEEAGKKKFSFLVSENEEITVSTARRLFLSWPAVPSSSYKKQPKVTLCCGAKCEPHGPTYNDITKSLTGSSKRTLTLLSSWRTSVTFWTKEIPIDRNGTVLDWRIQEWPTVTTLAEQDMCSAGQLWLPFVTTPNAAGWISVMKISS